jgi:hypothetical protein
MSDYLMTFDKFIFVMEERPRPGKFFLTNRSGIAVAYVSVTFHRNNPLRYERSKKVRTFNPGRFPIIADMIDDRMQPAQVTHTVAISCAVEPGEYRLVKWPADQHNWPTKCWIREVEKEFGQEIKPSLDLDDARISARLAADQAAAAGRRDTPSRPSMPGISALQQSTPSAPQSAVVTPNRRQEDPSCGAEEELLRKQDTEDDVEMTPADEEELTKVIDSC